MEPDHAAETVYDHCDGSPVEYVWVLTYFGEVEGVYSTETPAKENAADQMGYADAGDVEWVARGRCQEAGDDGGWELVRAEVRHA